NILIASGTGREDPDHVYLTDFGLTKRSSSLSGQTTSGRFIGTMDYVAPEQIGGKPADARDHLDSLGWLLAHARRVPPGRRPVPRPPRRATVPPRRRGCRALGARGRPAAPGVGPAAGPPARSGRGGGQGHGQGARGPVRLLPPPERGLPGRGRG